MCWQRAPQGPARGHPEGQSCAPRQSHLSLLLENIHVLRCSTVLVHSLGVLPAFNANPVTSKNTTPNTLKSLASSGSARMATFCHISMPIRWCGGRWRGVCHWRLRLWLGMCLYALMHGARDWLLSHNLWGARAVILPCALVVPRGTQHVGLLHCVGAPLRWIWPLLG